LDTAHRTAFLLGQFNQALRGRLGGGADIEVVADHVQKWVAVGKWNGRNGWRGRSHAVLAEE
jgi:hypothetical protein